jgi:CRISPR-associated protein Cas1
MDGCRAGIAELNMEDALVSVAGLHALMYCERLFYLEEVERVRLADQRVYAGRRLHVEQVEPPPDEEGERRRLELESEALGIRGAVDVLRRRDGTLVPYEHKRGRSAGRKGAREAWESDRVQVGAYALLAEESYGQLIEEARVRYHADNVTVVVPVDAVLRRQVQDAVVRAAQLRGTVQRPPVTKDERRCERCSLAPICLPEEARLAEDAEFRPVRLLPAHPRGQTVHVFEHGAHVGRDGERLVVRPREGEPSRVPIADVGQLVIHGLSQVSTQALRLCADHDVGVHWMTFGGGLVGSLAPGAASAQRQLRQFRALSDDVTALGLSRRLVYAKLSGQLRYLLRATRGDARTKGVEAAIAALRFPMRKCRLAANRSELLGLEGSGAAAYFGALPELLSPDLDARLRYSGRTRRPPRDRINALLGYAYGMLYREVVQAIVSVGLHPGVGFYHQPRSAAHTLALDLVELFRVPIVDMSLVGALNRRTFDPDEDFEEAPGRVLLSESGRKKTVEVVERRKNDVWRHDVVDYSLSYARMIELEVRLLEKEWMDEGGLFARFRLR